MFRSGLLNRISMSLVLVFAMGLGSAAAAQKDGKAGDDQSKPAPDQPLGDQTTTDPAKADQAKAADDQSGDPLKRPIEEKRRKQNAKSFKRELRGDHKTWLDQDVRWIISDDERKAFMQLSNDEERDQFIEAFWQRRNPNPDSEDNEFKEEHYRRIAYANEHFAAGIPGYSRMED